VATRPDYALWHGSPDPPQELRLLRAGPLECVLDGVDLRYVRCNGVEVVRRIYAAVRDRNWNTVPGVASAVEVDDGGDRFEVRFHVRHVDGGLDFGWDGTITGAPEGRVAFALDGVAARPLLYNRIGFCVLHPFRETAGRPFRARTPDGEQTGDFPLLIGPQRFENGVYVPLFPSFDRLEIDLEGGGVVRFEFEGDLWEDEDQRNWTDASFKTYCTPLALGFPHELDAGGRIEQRVSVSVPRPPAAAGAGVHHGPPTLTIGGPLGLTLPPIGLALAEDGVPAADAELELLRALRPAHLRVEAHLDAPGWEDGLAAALAERARLDVPLELALFLRAEHAGELDRLVERLRGVPLARVLVVAAGGGTATPEETTPAELVRLVRAVLGEAPVAGGTDMNFCELNRTRPEAAAMDAVFYSIVAQIHAFDDLSVVETLEAQGETVTSAAAIAEERPVHVSPITLRRRYNAHATVAEAGPAEGELPDSVDPRQRSLLGAAWTAGSVENLAEAGAASLTYYETTGWRGVVERELGSPLPDRFPSRPGQAFPLYHVLADVCEWQGAELLACRASDPLAVAGLAVRRGRGLSMLVANLTPEAQTVTVDGAPSAGIVRRLNEATAERAGVAPEEFRRSGERVDGLGRLVLGPFETVRVDA
jgi:hypothetical protein